jgi:hypothetical protein
VRTGAAVGAGFDILGEGDLNGDQLASGGLQPPATLLQTGSAGGASRPRTAAFNRGFRRFRP